MSDYSEPFRLLDLIPEIFTNVCEHLEDADLISLRASCRTARDKALHTFGGRFFRVLHCFLHAVSLEILLEIASHGELSQYVREVSIYLAPVHLKDEAYLEDDRDEAFEPEHSTTELPNENLLRADVEDARFQLLSAALAKLGHIRIVFIDAKKPLHIPLQPAVRCGYKYAKVETAKPSPFREESICNYSELESVFQLIDTHLKPHNIAIDMAIHGDIVPESTLQSTNTLEKPAWIQHIAPQLRFLALMVTETNWTFWKDVLSRTSNLVELVIDGWATHFQTVFKPITNDAIYSGPLSQSKLHSVLFQGLHMDEEPTINFLHHHRHTLAEVRIVNCTLQQGSWRPILITIGNLPFLRVIRFHVLVTFEQADGSSTENFKRYDDYMEQSAKWAIYISRAPVPRGRFTQESMHLLDDGILLVMATILQDFRTIRMGSRYHLDLRKANAFAQQLIDWRDGRWMDTPKMQRMDFFRQVEAQRLREEEAEAEDAAEDAVALSASVNSSLMSAGPPLSPGAPTAAMPQPLSIPAHTGNTGPSIPPTDSNTTPQRSVGRAPTRTMTTLSTKKKRREYLLKRLRGLVQIVQARFQ